MTAYIRAEEARVDTDEGRFVLRVWDVDGTEVTIDIHPFAIEFLENVKAEIGPYADEAALARSLMPTADPEDGYGVDDPKHPTYHERMVGGA